MNIIMQEYRPQRSAEGSQGGVPTWLLEEQEQLQQQRQQMAAHTPTRNRTNSTEGGTTSPSYAGLSRSPDTRRAYYKSNQTSTLDRHQLRERRHQRQQQQQQQQQQMAAQQRVASGASTGPRHQGVVNNNSMNVQNMPSSDPIYLDIDPSIHHEQHATAMGSNATGYPSRMQDRDMGRDIGVMPIGPSSSDSQFSTPSQQSNKRNNNSKSPSRLRSLNCTAAAPTEVRPTSRTSMSSNSNSNSQQHSNGNSPSPSYVNRQTSNTESAGAYNMNMNIANNNGWQSRGSQHYTYVNPYVSSVAQQYRVPGGMFPNQPNHSYVNTSTSTSTSNGSNYQRQNPPSPYNNSPIGPDNHGLQSHQESLIMFGDDYDLGSINTGMSQQELLKKRRDVKKRREGKSSKKKKNHKKERIINMPPRMLSMGSWDTSPITRLTSRDNSQHTPYKDNMKEEQVSEEKFVLCYCCFACCYMQMIFLIFGPCRKTRVSGI